MAANFQNMTVKALRELAREHVGPGFSRLKTKSELVAALQKVFSEKNHTRREVASPAANHRGDAASAESRAKPVVAGPRGTSDVRVRPAAPAAEDCVEVRSTVPPQASATPLSAPRVGEQVHGAPLANGALPHDAPGATAKAEPARRPSERSASGAPEGILSETERDLVQAFGKARAQCSDPFFLNESLEGVLPYDEALGELPESYDEESLVLLTKGPYALYLYWDFSQETLAKLQKMQGAVTCLRLFAGDQMVRELECTLNDRSWYFHGLQPGLTYRVELVAISAEGDVMRIGPSSNAVQLPSDAPSPLIDDRFIRLPFDVSASSVAEAIRMSEKSEKRELPPLSKTLRALLYQASGGHSGRGFGSSNQLPEERAPIQEGQGAASGADSKEGVLRRGIGARSTGPWSGTLLDAWGSPRPSSDTLCARRQTPLSSDDSEGDPPAR